MDITPWLLWFLKTLEATLQASLDKIERTLAKTRFWQRYHDAGLLSERVKVLNRLFEREDDNFAHGISASQYQAAAKVS